MLILQKLNTLKLSHTKEQCKKLALELAFDYIIDSRLMNLNAIKEEWGASKHNIHDVRFSFLLPSTLIFTTSYLNESLLILFFSTFLIAATP